jgi:hypothetical protein
VDRSSPAYKATLEPLLPIFHLFLGQLLSTKDAEEIAQLCKHFPYVVR